ISVPGLVPSNFKALRPGQVGTFPISPFTSQTWPPRTGTFSWNPAFWLGHKQLPGNGLRYEGRIPRAWNPARMESCFHAAVKPAARNRGSRGGDGFGQDQDNPLSRGRRGLLGACEAAKKPPRAGGPTRVAVRSGGR